MILSPLRSVYAWQVKWRANAFRINFDLHRAGGLWFWVLLFVFAWSSVMLGLRPVYDRVTKAIFDYHSDEENISSVTLPQPLDNPKLGWREAQTLLERAMAQIAAQHGFTITRPYGMAYIPEFGVYPYAVRAAMTFAERDGTRASGSTATRALSETSRCPLANILGTQ